MNELNLICVSCPYASKCEEMINEGLMTCPRAILETENIETEDVEEDFESCPF